MESGTETSVEICRCEAVTRGAVDAAIAAGATTVDDVKRRTRCGMGLCQGIYCMPQIAALLAKRLGDPLVEIGPMTARAPVRPLPLEELVGG
ncbi:MAG TPA: (2Fe-2S)-binding protein [Thermomicrobiales bacterium]|nr:(2Fe-2S)-binding protein [Thermomicrobiales bacterium]